MLREWRRRPGIIIRVVRAITLSDTASAEQGWDCADTQWICFHNDSQDSPSSQGTSTTELSEPWTFGAVSRALASCIHSPSTINLSTGHVICISFCRRNGHSRQRCPFLLLDASKIKIG